MKKIILMLIAINIGWVSLGRTQSPSQSNDVSISVVLPIDVVIEGDYIATGSYLDGASYEGVVAVTRSGKTYKVAWIIDKAQYIGTGVLHGDSFAIVTIGYGADAPPMVAVYKVNQDRTFDGTYTVLGSSGVGFETWQPRKRQPNKR
ncbi:MAG: hypothetical protein JNK86_04290 [Alphaproteobacteria bacterium]|nr:hypothetical protein [Alphaproteobacteria bacterium]